MCKPWQLFRYRAVNEFLWQELELAQLYCSPQNGLNDPFDCRLDWRGAFARALASPNLPLPRKRTLEDILRAFTTKDPLLEVGFAASL